MMQKPLWDRCIHHRGTAAKSFIEMFFAEPQRKVLVIGGAGFDPRSYYLAEQLSNVCKERVSAIFIREERPNPNDALKNKADDNDARIRSLIGDVQILQVDVFDIDNAPVGGRRATKLLDDTINPEGVTDVVLDCSALSVGVMFPIARYCLELVKNASARPNLHVFVLDDPSTDAAIRSISCGKSAALHTFSGGLNLDGATDAARLWLPQLGSGRRDVLNLIHQDVKPHAVCPIVPFPSADPRTGDRLIEEYGDLFESVTDPMVVAWHVDSRDIVYAHEKSPLDLYRSILRIDNARRRVFAQTGGSQLILSPLGSKAVAIGLLMAALDRGFAVVSVESLEYQMDLNSAPAAINNSAELVHVWLYGEAYSSSQQEADT